VKKLECIQRGDEQVRPRCGLTSRAAITAPVPLCSLPRTPPSLMSAGMSIEQFNAPAAQASRRALVRPLNC
jgi:hypothetical protein